MLVPISIRFFQNCTEYLHSDLCHWDVTSKGGNKHHIVINDESIIYRFVEFLKTKDEASAVIKEQIHRSENVTGRKVKRCRTDWGTELVNKDLMAFFKANNIIHETSVPHGHEQNGFAERENRTLQEHARCLLHQRNVDKRYWPDAVRTAAISFNMIPNRDQKDVTPFELWHGAKPDVSLLRTFGVTAFGSISKEQRKGKSAPVSREGIFLGYGDHLHQYKLLRHDQSIRLYRDVKFDETMEDVEDDDDL